MFVQVPSGGSGVNAPPYPTGSGTLPAIGAIQTPYNGGLAVPLWMVKDSGGTDRSFIQYGAGDAFQFGFVNSSQTLTILFNSKTETYQGTGSNTSCNGWQYFDQGSGQSIINLPNTRNIGFFGNGSFGGGTNVISVGNAVTAPTANPTNAFILWQDPTSNSIQCRLPSGTQDVLAPATTGTPNTQALTHTVRQAVVRTTDATTTTIITFALSNNTGGHFRIRVVGRNTAAGSDSVAGTREGVANNNAGTATATVFTNFTGAAATASIGASLATATITVAVSGANMLVQVTGVAATTVDWEARLEYLSD